MYDIDAVNLEEIFKTENIEAIIHSATNYSNRTRMKKNYQNKCFIGIELIQTQKNMVCKHS